MMESVEKCIEQISNAKGVIENCLIEMASKINLFNYMGEDLGVEDFLDDLHSSVMSMLDIIRADIKQNEGREGLDAALSSFADKVTTYPPFPDDAELENFLNEILISCIMVSSNVIGLISWEETKKDSGKIEAR